MSSSPRPGDEPTVVASTPSTVAAEVAPRTGQYRWMICALLFFATTINYVDRQVLGFLAPDLQRSIGWNEAEYGWIVTAFQAAYAISLLVVGRVMDWLGTRKGFSLTIVVWSLAAMGHSLARSAFGFGVARLRWGWARAATSPRRSRPWPSGSRRRSARSPRASSTPGRTSARSSSL